LTTQSLLPLDSRQQHFVTVEMCLWPAKSHEKLGIIGFRFSDSVLGTLHVAVVAVHVPSTGECERLGGMRNFPHFCKLRQILAIVLPAFWF
jgi:hypothetical protein